MARFKDIPDVKTGNLFRVHPSKLVVDPDFNVRLHDDDFEQRVESYALMFLSGSRCPALLVYLRGEEIVVIDGHMRRLGALRAIELGAEIADVDVIQFSGNDADRISAMLCSGSGRSWSPMELLSGYKRLRGFGWSEKEIAGKVGKTEQHVKDILALADADTSVQGLVREGKVSATMAIQVVRQDGFRAIDTLTAAVETAKKSGKTRATAKHVSQARGITTSNRDVGRAVKDIVADVRRQAEDSGIGDDEFDDHAFLISGRLLRTLLQSQ